MTINELYQEKTQCPCTLLVESLKILAEPVQHQFRTNFDSSIIYKFGSQN